MADAVSTFTVRVDTTILTAKMRHATSSQKEFVGGLLLLAMEKPAQVASVLAREGGTVARDWGISVTNVA